MNRRREAWRGGGYELGDGRPPPDELPPVRDPGPGGALPADEADLPDYECITGYDTTCHVCANYDRHEQRRIVREEHRLPTFDDWPIHAHITPATTRAACGAWHIDVLTMPVGKVSYVAWSERGAERKARRKIAKHKRERLHERDARAARRTIA